MNGMIFDIQHFCVDDGPGIRTTVFMKGCPLRCAWCHNPEGLISGTQIAFHADQCVRCGRCAPACANGCHVVTAEAHTLNRAECSLCAAYTEACPASALRRMGRKATVDEVLADVLKDRIFYEQSGGGMTLSGGEPFNKNAGPANAARCVGPTSVVLSACALDQVRLSGGQALDMHFGVRNMDDPVRKQKLIALIRTYLSCGGLQMQVNALSSETLKKAYAQPENYKNLIVRIGGHSRYYNDLEDDVKKEFIHRISIEEGAAR